MSSPDSTKKRRIAKDSSGGDNNGGGGGGDDGTTMSIIFAKLNDMQNEMNGMKNELDSCISSRDSMQKEMDGLQSRLSHLNELEKKCTHLDTTCESLQRSVQILSKESQWEYSAPDIPLSHWRGFDEQYTQEMYCLLSDIKRCTSGLRRGDVSSVICLGEETSDIFLQHDDILLPHWKELANALQLHELNHYELFIFNVQLTSEVLDLLTPALKGKPLMELILERNGFANNEGTKFITEFIKHNNELDRFDCMNNQISNMEDTILLVDAIVSHPSITQVQIENCLVGDEIYEVLRPIFASNKHWVRIDLERNNIQTEGDTAIPDYIATNPPLENLYLSGNKLNDDDALLIARALKHNTNLKELVLDNNNITHIGKEALSKAVYDPTSLNSMSDCNHTCIIHVDGGMRNPLGCGNDNRMLSSSILKRGAKIYQLLSNRNKEGSNVRHLNSEFDGEDEEEDSLKLVPQVLECVHRYPRASKLTAHPLSIIYEVLRGWKMPELYEKRN